jgi:hypothetical protein
MRGLCRGNAEVDHDPSSGKGSVKEQHMKVGFTGLGMPCKNVRDCIRIDTPVCDHCPHQVYGICVGHFASCRQMEGRKGLCCTNPAGIHVVNPVW